MTNYIQILHFFTVLFTLKFSTAQEPILSLSLAQSTLPYRMAYTAPIYDGSDYIYLFGGFTPDLETRLNTIYRYSVSQDTLTFVTNMSLSYQGFAERDPTTGNIFYFSRYEIYKFDPITESFTTLGRNSDDMQLSAGFKSDPTSRQVLFFGGFSQDVVSCYDMALEELCPSEGVSTEFGMESVAVSLRGMVYLFYSVSPPLFPLQRLRLLDLDNYQVTTGPLNFPRLDNLPSVVTNGRDIFIAGGYNRTTSGMPTTGILRLDPSNINLTPGFLPVSGWMVGEEEMLYGSGVVYVEQVNRIYFFGGIVGGPGGGRGTFHDKIWFIDLSPLNNN